MTKTTFLFPGQGSQYPNMVHDIINQEGANKDNIISILSQNNLDINNIDTDGALLHTENVQLSLLICSVVSAKMCIDRGINPDFVAGSSIGAFGAAVIAEAISFEDAIAIVKKRGLLMENAYPSGYGMMACIGFGKSRLENEVTAFNLNKPTDKCVYLANINTATQIVLAGSFDSLKLISSILEQKGIQKTHLLKMNVPSHCVLLEDAAKHLYEEVSKINISTPKIPYLSNIRGRMVRTANDVKTDLGQNIAHPVQWYDGMQLIYELGSRFFLEMMPSGVLDKIVSQEFNDCESYGIDLKNWDTIKYRYNELNN